MEPINLNDLQRFVGFPAEIVIQDSVVRDQAPAVQKSVKKIQLCPDKTHIRFYFDDFYFLAVPMASQVKETDTEWSAFDKESGLHYHIRKV
ncbi:hypothetical protein [Neobacillus sp. PS3-40]|uniref:hypothetical protein n=1 Tax=Neobacillus sp. PS3-40 TaxID=3070679 RepID=UPI0027DFC0DE|nr:hypothetical protein [Neobacillus sp. PS3-40]WML42923.1 hypothetical protein RCG20_13915 [Neobacillus sp. PS3-40]